MPVSTEDPSVDATVTWRQWAILAVAASSSAAITLDATVVNVTLPTIVNDLGVNTSQAEWFTAIYPLIFAAGLIVFGRLADTFGARSMLLAGSTVFGLASYALSQSNTAELLLASRAGQGLGGAMTIPAALALTSTTFKGRHRATAFAFWGATIGIFAALGPLVGGYLTGTYSWRWAFAINIPIAIVIVVAGWVILPRAYERQPLALDFGGTFLLTSGLALGIYALVSAQDLGWTSSADSIVTFFGWSWPSNAPPLPPTALIVSGLLLASFALVEVRRTRQDKATLINLSLLKIPTFRNGTIATALIALGELGLLLTLPLYFNAVRGYEAATIGLTLAVVAAGAFIGSLGSAPLARRFSAVRALQMGLAAEIIGIAYVGFVISETTIGTDLAAGLAIYGVGMGVVAGQLTNVVLTDVPREVAGQAAAIKSTARQMGSATGTAIIGILLVAGLSTASDELRDIGLDDPQAQKVAQSLATSAGQSYPALIRDLELDEAAERATSTAFVTSVEAITAATAGLLTISLIVTIVGIRPARESDRSPPHTRPRYGPSEGH